MDPDQGYWIWVWEDTLFWRQSGALLGITDPLIFGAKTAPCCSGQIRLFLAPKLRTAMEGRSEIGKLIYWILKYSKVL
jgi:hypothetical protein